MANAKLKLVPMLPADPENDIEVAPPGTSGETINQRRIRELQELREKRLDINKRYAATVAQTQSLLINGATLQQGRHHLDFGVSYRRRPKYKQILIDLKGEAYQKRILENTTPHAYLRVRVT